jgi:hypothetical protein
MRFLPLELISQLFSDEQGPTLSEYLWLGLLVAVLIGGAYAFILLGQPDHPIIRYDDHCGC